MNHPPSDNELAGMTINERLVACGLLEAFESAARRRDRAAMIWILSQVALTPEQAAWSADTMLANAEKYGF